MVGFNQNFPLFRADFSNPIQPVLVISLDSGEELSFVLPVFSEMGATKDEADPGKTRPMDVEQIDPSKEKGESGEDNEVGEDKLDLIAKWIAKEVIPEKLCPPVFIGAGLPHPEKPIQQSKKEEKTFTEPTENEAPENVTLAIPKEATKPAADQSSFDKSRHPFFPKFEFKSDLKETTAKEGVKSPSQQSEKAEKKEDRKINKSEKDLSQDVRGEVSIKSHTDSLQISKFKPKETEGAKTDVPVKDVTTVKEKENILKGQPDIMGIPYASLKEEPAEVRSKREKNSGPIEEIEAKKPIHPRKDIFVPRDKSDNEGSPQPFRMVDENLTPKVPLAADFPLSRDAIFRQATQPRNLVIREDQGYRLGDLLLMLLSTGLYGATTLEKICRELSAKEHFFKAWLGLKAGLPTFRMLWFLLNRLDPKHFKRLLKSVIGSNTSLLLRDVHVWESHRGFVLGELKPLVKSDSKRLLLESLEWVDLQGATVTLEASSLIRSAAQKIRTKGGNYLLCLKEEMSEEANQLFEESETPKDSYQDILRQGTVTLVREIDVTERLEWFSEKEEWPELQSYVRLKTQSFQEHRLIEKIKTYLSSFLPQADKIAQVLKVFSLLETQVEWMADCDFLLQSFEEHEAANISLLCSFSEELLRQDTSYPHSIEAKRKRLHQSYDYLRHLIRLQI